MMVMMVGVARADEVTFDLNASYVFNNGDGSVFPFLFTDPILRATGTISFDPLAALVHDLDTISGTAPLNYDLLFSGAFGSLEYAGTGVTHCINYGEIGIADPGYISCTLVPNAGSLQPGDFWGFQTNLFNVDTLVPGYSFYGCSARNTRYPDGTFGNMASGICGATSTASIQGINGGIYGLRPGEDGSFTSTSAKFTVVNTPEPKVGLLALALAVIMIIWRKK